MDQQNPSISAHSPRAGSLQIALAPLHETHEIIPMEMDVHLAQRREAATSLFVMLPLDCVSRYRSSAFTHAINRYIVTQVNGDGVFKYAKSAWFAQALNFLASSGACGVAVDVWVS